NTWGGGRSVLDHETDKERRKIKKRTSDEVYNEEFDSGRTKKMKTIKKSWESQSWDRDSGNDFQKVQDFRNSSHGRRTYQYTSPHFNTQDIHIGTKAVISTSSATNLGTGLANEIISSTRNTRKGINIGIVETKNILYLDI
ncbi:putative Ubiquitin carboxyl-terminal hydrolase 36-like 2, partial [Homarus americanus]